MEHNRLKYQRMDHRVYMIVARVKKLESDQKWDEARALEDKRYQLRDESRDKGYEARQRKDEAIQALNESLVAERLAEEHFDL